MSTTRVFQRYVAIGDSSTEGLDDPDGQGGYRGWANRLAEALAAAQSPPLLYANLGVRGRSTRQIRDEQLERAAAMRPDLVTLFSGTNDVVALRFDADSVARDVEHMQRTLIEGGAIVLGFTLPDLSPVLPLARPIAARVRALNDALRSAAAASGAILVDFARHPVGSDPRLWSPDRIHANSAGHARIAAALAWALGLPGADGTWSEPLPPAPRRSWREKVGAEMRWSVEHFLPWVWRHLQGRSSGDSRGAKRPNLAPICLLALLVVIGCTRISGPVQAPPPAPAVMPSEEIGSIPPAVDLSGTWTTGREGEPQVPTVITHTECTVNPAVWVIDQKGDSIQAWSFPETYNQGIAAKGPGLTRISPATGRISGVEVRIDDAESQYRLRYDSVSHHLRGTLNGKSFWAARHVVRRPGACGAIP